MAAGDLGTNFDHALRELVRQEVRAVVSEILSEQAGRSPDALVTPRQAAEERGMSVSWIRARLRDGSLPFERLGRSIRIRRADLDRLGRRERRSDDAGPGERARRILAVVAGGKR